MAGRFDGKVALITGAARGQGRSHAVRLASEGADVILADICAQIDTALYPLSDLADLEETVRLVEKTGRRAVFGQADVRNLADLSALAQRGVDELGRLDVVVANAGITSFGSTHELTEDQWDDMIAVNLSGVWRTAKATLPHLIAGGRGGSFVITASVCAFRAYPNLAHYDAAKHGLIGLMRTMAHEYAEQNIRVNAVCPTQVDTPMIMNEVAFRLFRPDLEKPTREDYAPASQKTNSLPIPWVEPEDVSAAVAFLASDDARYVTGVAVPIDAGNLLK